MILNEAEARRLVAGQSPVGREISFNGTKGPWREVVGVVADTRNYALEREPWPEIYIPYEQDPSLVMFFVLRTTGDPMSFAKALRSALTAVDPDVPVARMATMDEVVEKLVAPRRFRLILLGSFAVLAVLLAALGLYGVISYAITQRTREIGVRVALGADRRDLLKLVLQQGLKLALLGIGIGTLGSLALTRYLESLLYGVTSTDPLTFSVVALILAVVALVATAMPARRAMRMDPIVALRYE